MSKINWNMISDGRIFELLIGVLIRHKYPKVRVYNRPGPDASIDAKSADGKIVYQMKYIKNSENFSSIISQSKKELQKVIEYKNPNHKNNKHWDGVEKWHLITNAQLNPNDEKKWNKEIVGHFQKEVSLKVELWSQSHLDKLLIDYPNVKKEYFDGENRVLQSLPEAIDAFKESEILSLGFNAELIIGRNKELEQFSNFIDLKDKKIILIYGAGGVGKTRFAIEAAYQANEKKEYDIFWAHTATLESSNNWFQSIVPGRKSILVIDEPKEKASIEILLEQVRSQKLLGWKFIIISRIAKDPIIESLNTNLHNNIQSIEIKPLDETNSIKLINVLTKKSKKQYPEEWKKYLFKISNGIPIWMAMAIYLIEKEDRVIDLFKDELGLVKKYLEEVVSSLSLSIDRSKLFQYIKAIAVLQPLLLPDRQDSQLHDNFQTLFGDKEVSLSELEMVTKALERLGFIIKRGRLLEIKPDAIRDYILISRIGENQNESKEWLQKTLSIKNIEKRKSALMQLSKISFYQRHQKNIDRTFFDEIWNIFSEKVKKGNLDDQYIVLEIASDISYENPLKFLNLIKELRLNKKQSSSSQPLSKGMRHDYLILLQLPRKVYQASSFIKDDESETKKFFDELLDLYSEEHNLINKEYAYLRNDGQRVQDYIKKLMQSNNHRKHKTYKEVIFKWILKELDQINLSKNNNLLLEITKEFLKIKRRTDYVKDWHLIIESYFIPFQSKEQRYRYKIFEKIWSILKSNKSSTSTQVKMFLWKLLKTYHSHLNECSSLDKQIADKNDWIKELEDHFVLLKQYIQNNNIHISEIKLLQLIWGWNLEYDPRKKFKKYAQECENLINNKNEIYKDIKSIFDSVRKSDKLKVEIEKYISNHDIQSYTKIKSLIDHLFSYDHKSLEYTYIISIISKRLMISTQPALMEYVDQEISQKHCNHHFKFACEAIENRKNNDKDLLKYWKKIQSLKQKEFFLKKILITTVYNKSDKILVKEKFKFVCKVLPDFLDRYSNLEESGKKCLLHISDFLGVSLFIEFNQSKELIEQIFNKIEPNQSFEVFQRYINGLTHGTRFFTDDFISSHSENIFFWLVSLLQYVPSMDWVASIEKNLKIIKRKLKNKFTVIEFVKILEKRLALLQKNPSWGSVYSDNNFLKLISPIQSENANSEKIRSAVVELLKFNGHHLLHYVLPRITKAIDPLGFLLPSIICENIQKKISYCVVREGVSEEWEWVRYSGYYDINSRPWRHIAKLACERAVKKTESQKKCIFEGLLWRREFFKGVRGEVAPHFYRKVEKAQEDLDKEKDPNIKQFMKWRLDFEKNRLEDEKNRIIEKE